MSCLSTLSDSNYLTFIRSPVIATPPATALTHITLTLLEILGTGTFGLPKIRVFIDILTDFLLSLARHVIVKDGLIMCAFVNTECPLGGIAQNMVLVSHTKEICSQHVNNFASY